MDGATRTPAATTVPEQALQLAHPSSEIIWSRAVEVFGSDELARQWMGTPLVQLGQSSPAEYANSNVPEKLREILVILGQIDYGLLP